MGISMPKIFKGQISLNLTNESYETGQFYGEIVVKDKSINPLYVHVNLIGIEHYITDNEEVTHTYLKQRIHCQKIKNKQETQSFFCEAGKNLNKFHNNFSIIQQYQFSSTLYIECFLANNKNADSKQSYLNSKLIHVIKTKQHLLKQKSIFLNLEPNLVEFSPKINLQIDKSHYKIGDSLKGLLKIDNSKYNYDIVKNHLTIFQIVEIQNKNTKLNKKLTPNKFAEKDFGSMKAERSIFLIDIEIDKCFLDAWSYFGELYKIQYMMQFEFLWENGISKLLEQEIFVINDL